MTRHRDRIRTQSLRIAAVGCVSMAFLPSVAAAAPPPAAVDQYKPAPPGLVAEDRPGDNPDNDGGPSTAGAATASDPGSSFGSGEPTEGGETETSVDSRGDPDRNLSSGGVERDPGPSIAGYPTSPAIVGTALIIILAIAGGLGAFAWRRYRGTPQLGTR